METKSNKFSEEQVLALKGGTLFLIAILVAFGGEKNQLREEISKLVSAALEN